MLAIYSLQYFYRQYPANFRTTSILSKTQKISRIKYADQQPFGNKLITGIMRKGCKLKILHLTNKWWINSYRYFFRYQINFFSNVTNEEIMKTYLDQEQFIQFLKKHYNAWTLDELLYFRLSTLISIFQLKQYKINNMPSWQVVYLPPQKRLIYMYSLFVLHFRASRLLNKKLIKNFDLIFSEFIIQNDTKQEIYDIKIQTYKQFLF